MTSGGPKIPRTNLVFEADPANTFSSTAGSNIVLDLTGRTGSGTAGPANLSISGSNCGVWGMANSTEINFSNKFVNYVTGTAAIWCKPLVSTVGHKGIFTNQNTWGMFTFSNEYVVYDWSVGGGNRATGINLYTDGLWHHCAISFQDIDAGDAAVNVFLDGRLVLVTSVTQNAAGSNTTIASGNGLQYWQGYIGQTLFYDRKLAVDEIQQIYDATRGRYER